VGARGARAGLAIFGCRGPIDFNLQHVSKRRPFSDGGGSVLPLRWCVCGRSCPRRQRKGCAAQTCCAATPLWSRRQGDSLRCHNKHIWPPSLRPESLRARCVSDQQVLLAEAAKRPFCTYAVAFCSSNKQRKKQQWSLPEICVQSLARFATSSLAAMSGFAVGCTPTRVCSHGLTLGSRSGADSRTSAHFCGEKTEEKEDGRRRRKTLVRMTSEHKVFGRPHKRTELTG
jgi:hypothetical protein